MLPFQQAEENLTRRYKREESVQRIQTIKALRKQGQSIRQIKELLARRAQAAPRASESE